MPKYSLMDQKYIIASYEQFRCSLQKWCVSNAFSQGSAPLAKLRPDSCQMGGPSSCHCPASEMAVTVDMALIHT